MSFERWNKFTNRAIKHLSDTRRPWGIVIASDKDGRDVYIVKDAAGREHAVTNLDNVRILKDPDGTRRAVYVEG